MAEIFLARRRGATPGDLVVVKRILPHLAEDEHFVTMFRDEARLASRILHDNVCRVQTLGHVGQTYFIVMEYLHGVALSRALTRLAKQKLQLDLRLVAAIIYQACAGLHHAHELRDEDGRPLNVVHRDVSPPNIFVTSDGTVKLLDFGIAKAQGASSKTRTGTVKGKNAYMSPEQILGKPLDRRSDVFALGTVLYELLAVKRLFHRDSDFLTFKAITEEPIPDIRERRPDIPEALRLALQRALAREVDRRWPTAKAFGEAVAAAVAPLGGMAGEEDVAALIDHEFADDLAAKLELCRKVSTELPAITADARLVPNLSSTSGNLIAAVTAAMAERPPTELGGEIDLDAPTIALNLGPRRGPDRTPVSASRALPLRADPTPSSVIIESPTPTVAGRPSARSGVQPQPQLPGPAAALAATAAVTGPDSRPKRPRAVTIDMSAFPDEPTQNTLIADRRRSLARVGLIGIALIAVAVVALLIGRSSKEGEEPGATARPARSSAASGGTGASGASGSGAGAAAAGGASSGSSDKTAAPSGGGATAAGNGGGASSAARQAAGPGTDGGIPREDIQALSRFGFFSIDSEIPATIYIDGKRIGETPLERLPLSPGDHKVKAVPTKGKRKPLRFEVRVYGGRDTDYPTLAWP